MSIGNSSAEERKIKRSSESPADPRSWENFLDAKDREHIEGYNNADIEKDDPAFARCAFFSFLNNIKEMDFENATAECGSFFQLIRHNPHFRAEIEALKKLVEGENVLNQFFKNVEATL
jgi:hypothetical protein